MEESKTTTTIIFAVDKSSELTEQHIREYLEGKDAKIFPNSSPKGYRVQLDKETATSLIEKGEDTLNGEKINFAEDDPFCTLYIKGITEKLTEKDLTAALSTEGRICMASIPKDSSHKPKGMSFIRFNRRVDALAAAEKHPTLTINDVALECSKFDGKAKETVNESATFKNIPDAYGEEELLLLFSQYGSVANITINEENSTGIVSFSTSGSVQKAVQSLNGKAIAEKVFILTSSDAEKKRAGNYNNLYVGNVDISVTEEEIKETFGKYGEIESLLMPTRKIKSDAGELIDIRKPYIYISFKDPKAASDVIKEMDTRVYWNKALDIDYYDPDKRRKNFEKNAPVTQANQNMIQEFANAMMTMMAQFSNLNMRNRGGYSGGPQYRGGSQYQGRGGRGSTRGGGPRGGASRGGRGGASRGGPGGYYGVKSQYEHPKVYMGGAMGMPGMGGMGGMGGMSGPPPVSQPMVSHGYGHMDTGMGYAPPMPAALPPHSMPAPMPQAPIAHISQKPAPQQNDEELEVLGYSIEEIMLHENEVGTYLYNKIELSHGGDIAGRIAGMFLDLPKEEIYNIIHENEVYQKYIRDAENLIQNETPAEENE
jgi:RNA recognition motif-containing protein